jgi:hypothetical protein
MRKAKKALEMSLDMPKGTKTKEIGFAGLLEEKEGLYYFVKGRVDLKKGIVLSCEYEKADILEIGLNKAGKHLYSLNRQ